MSYTLKNEFHTVADTALYKMHLSDEQYDVLVAEAKELYEKDIAQEGEGETAAAEPEDKAPGGEQEYPLAEARKKEHEQEEVGEEPDGPGLDGTEVKEKASEMAEAD